MSRLLLVSDLHLTDRPQDEYRWKVFDQLSALCQDYPTTLWILGDLTETKDYHSSRLVNRVVNALRDTRRKSKINEVHILKGNHDGIDPNWPYFGFLSALPWCTFHINPTFIEHDRILALPHTRNYEKDWANVDWENAELVFAHCTVKGAKSETGITLDGIPDSAFNNCPGERWCGDVHVPQVVGRVHYVGAPYPIRYGDAYQGRCVCIGQSRKHSSHGLQNISKPVITITPATKQFPKVNAGDQVKVRIELDQTSLGMWHDLRRKAQAWCKEQGAILGACELSKSKETAEGEPKARRSAKTRTPLDFFEHYATSLDEGTKQLGREFLTEGT